MHQPPFTRNYVIGVTLDHQIEAVDFSIKKTLGRAYQPALSSDINQEIVMTLQTLLNMRQELIAKKESL